MPKKKKAKRVAKKHRPAISEEKTPSLTKTAKAKNLNPICPVCENRMVSRKKGDPKGKGRWKCPTDGCDPSDFEIPIAERTGRPCELCRRLHRLCDLHRPQHLVKPGGPTPLYSAEEVEEALNAAKGIIATTAQNLNVHRSTLVRYIDKYDLREVVDSWRESMVDTAESKLMEALESGEGWAVKFTLARLGKNRGYTERQEITDPNAPDATSTVPLEQLPLEVRRQMVRLLEPYMDPTQLGSGEKPEPKLVGSGRGK